MSWVFIHGSDSHSLAPNDRAALYGDALFETLLWSGASLVLAPLHWQRLLSGAVRLKIALDPHLLEEFVAQVEAQLKERAWNKSCAVRISVHRTADKRGYAFDRQLKPELVCSVSAAPQLSSEPAALGISAINLARQPLLAGIKHANRLEQVMAAQALRGQGYDDGFMCLDNGHVICTTRANVFALMGHVWYTPALNEAGVAGTRRAWFLERATQGWWDVQESELTLEQLYQADAVMISNALRGFQEVGSINGHQLSSSIQIQRVRQRYMDTLAAEL